MFNTKEKKERSLGAKLFLKPLRCNSPKCVTIRRPSRPGLHGKRRRGQLSEFGQQLLEKQRVKFSYGVKENYLEKIFKRAEKNPEITGDMIIMLLERRLDNVVFRLGLAPSRSIGRQLVGHGHIAVNGRKTKAPSYQVKIGDVITINAPSKDHPLFKNLPVDLKNYVSPEWLSLDSDKLEGKIISAPKGLDILFNVNLVVDYYSKQ
ncbi:MAG: 30S ribosomal protein S4 [bacterium]|nr:30S ribosomal protein S4 [bacterium]